MRRVKVNSNTNEVAEACKAIIDLSKKHPIVKDTYFTLTFEKLSEKLNELIQKINAGWLNSELREKDEARDLDVRAIFYEVEARCMRRSSASVDKALRIKAVLDRYGMKITGGSYTNESAQVRAMLSDLNASELAKDVRSIPDLKQLMDNLAKSQEEFDTSGAKLIEDKTARENSKSASVIAKELREIFNDELCGYLTAMAKVNPDKYKSFTDLLSTIIEENNNKVRDRLLALKRKREETSTELS